MSSICYADELMRQTVEFFDDNLITSDKNNALKRLVRTIKSANKELQKKQFMSKCSHFMSNTNVMHLTLDDSCDKIAEFYVLFGIMENRFDGKTFVVTGAGQGIGRALVEKLYELGATIYAISRSSGPLETLKTTCPNVRTVTVDLGVWSETRSVLGKFLKDVKIDGLVNNAGGGIGKPFEEFTEVDFDNTMNVNLKGVFNVTQILIPNINDGGSIVNVSSLAGLASISEIRASIYIASKAGLDGLTRALALEYGPRKIRVNSVNPTVVLTENSMNYWSSDRGDSLRSKIPLNRFAEVREVIDPIIFLLCDQSSFINGHSLPIEGGYLSC